MMQVQYGRYNNQIFFENKFKLQEKTIKLIEEKTRLSYDEMRFLSIDKAAELMKERAPIGEKIRHRFVSVKLALGKIYRNIGENLGLLEKQRNIYTDIH